MKQIKSERGQSLVELAISLVVLLYLLAGAVEFGLAFFQFVQLRDAAQEGALYGSISGNPTAAAAIEARVRNASTSPINLLDTSTVTVTQTIIGSACEGGGIEVEVTFNHQVFMPFMSQFIGDEIPLVATVTDTILSPLCP